MNAMPKTRQVKAGPAVVVVVDKDGMDGTGGVREVRSGVSGGGGCQQNAPFRSGQGGSPQ